MIELKHVVKEYKDKVALDDINVTFDDNESTVIVGPSGSGKSTLLRSIDLLTRPDSGTLTIDDLSVDFSKPLSQKMTFALRRKSGMVFQNWNLFPHLTVMKNITEAPRTVLKMSKEESERHARELLQLVGLDQYADQYPSQLSGGQQQRISICRALAMHPQFLLLDEPTSALDPELEMQVLRILEDLANRGQAMVVVTHNMEFARLVANKLIFVEDGKILFAGATEDFFNSDNARIQTFLAGLSLVD